jgi:streptogramin lyase
MNKQRWSWMIGCAAVAAGCGEPVIAEVRPGPAPFAASMLAPDQFPFDVHSNHAKKNPPGKLKAKPRNKDGAVANAPPPPPAAAVGGKSRIYTLDADFDEGAYNNVTHKIADQLQLDDTTTPFNFMWVAVSTKGTIVKIDTETGKVIGEYRSAPAGQPTDPSRTTVDKSGNVWATNRAGSSVVHIGLVENHQCIDRDGNGRIDTSTGLGDILDWTGGSADSAEDECIIHYTQVRSSGTRHVSVTVDNDLWVSGLGGRYFDLVDGITGAIVRQEPPVGYGGYGGLIDRNGVIWSARPLMRWDTTKPLSGPNGGNWTGYNHDSYGLCLDTKGNVWNTSLGGNQIRKFAANGALLGTYGHGEANAQGCVADRNDHIWVAHSLLGSSTVGHVKPDGTFVGNVAVGTGPTGVAVDARGKIWVTNYHSRNVSRIDPAGGALGPDGATRIGAVDLTTVDLGGNLYNYSDMTGSTLQGAPNTGTWVVIHDSQQAGTRWGTVRWTAKVTGDGFVKVTAASSPDGSTFGAPEAAANGVDLGVNDARFLKVSVAFQRSGAGVSPILYDLTIKTANEPPDCTKAAPSRSSLWPPNHKFESITIVGVTDPEGKSVTVKVTSIRQDEPIETTGDGNFTPDGKGVGTATADVRAERVGDPKKPGNGRVYHIAFTATDADGATCNGTVKVGVPHDQSSTPVDDGPNYDSTR